MPSQDRAPAYEPSRARRLGRCVRELRHARGWSHTRLAERAGVSERTVARLEEGAVVQPGVFTVAAVADALEVTVDGLAAATPVLGLWSTGYEVRTIESFVEAGVEAVADVRLTPISRKPGFSKTRLRGALPHAPVEVDHSRDAADGAEAMTR